MLSSDLMEGLIIPVALTIALCFLTGCGMDQYATFSFESTEMASEFRANLEERGISYEIESELVTLVASERSDEAATVLHELVEAANAVETGDGCLTIAAYDPNDPQHEASESKGSCDEN